MPRQSEFDLNSPIGDGHLKSRKGMAHEFGSDNYCASDGFSPAAGVFAVASSATGAITRFGVSLAGISFSVWFSYN
jgi:hypothetical protein